MILASSGRAREALPLADRTVARRPDLAEYGDTRAFVYMQLGDRGTALKQFEQNRRLDPKNARWALRITEVTLEQSGRQVAEQRFRSFREEYPEARMSPELRAAWSDLARSLERSPGPGK